MNTNSRAIDAVISTDMLERLLYKHEVSVIDIRSADEYNTGHIQGALNVPFEFWAITKDGLDLELPDEPDLLKLIKSSVLDRNSSVIIANKTDTTYSLANACRVTITLLYVGITNVSVLDGGYDKWIRESRKSSTEPSRSVISDFKFTVEKNMFANMDYVKSKVGKSVFLDARDASVYFGINQEKHASRAGHIPGAKSLPAPWMWTAEGTYKSREELNEIVGSVAGTDREKEIIIYCGVGGYTSAWWFVLTQMLGYKNVKFYDGSAQDWTRDRENKTVKYKWE